MLAMRPELFHGCTVATVLAGFDIPPWSDRFSVPEAKDGPHSFAMLAMRPELFHGCTVATVLAGFDIPPWSDRFSVPEAKAVPAPGHAGRLRAAATSSPENLCTAR